MTSLSASQQAAAGAADRPSTRSVLLKQGLFLICLTLVYLTFELGFNARLLDVVGGDTTFTISRSSGAPCRVSLLRWWCSSSC